MSAKTDKAINGLLNDVVPGFETVSGLYDTIGDLFGGGKSKKDIQNDVKRVSDFIIANNITNDAIIKKGSNLAKKTSPFGDKFNQWKKEALASKQFSGTSISETISQIFPNGNNNLLMYAGLGLLAFFIIKGK